MICLHVPDCHVRPWNVVYTARDSPGQPCAIVVVHQKRLKFKRGHRATRQCDITYIQRIYDTYKFHGTHICHFGRFSIVYSPGRVAICRAGAHELGRVAGHADGGPHVPRRVRAELRHRRVQGRRGGDLVVAGGDDRRVCGEGIAHRGC